jgi:hypothetical protein
MASFIFLTLDTLDRRKRVRIKIMIDCRRMDVKSKNNGTI